MGGMGLMLEQPPFPWQQKEREDSTTISLRLVENLKSLQKSLPVTPKTGWFLAGGGLLACTLLVLQICLLELFWSPKFSAADVPQLPVQKLQVIPAPIRYNLLFTRRASLEDIDSSATASDISQAEPLPPNTLNAPSPLLTLSAPPPEVIQPPPPPEPSFKLMGIAVGDDGAAAILKVTDEASGIKEQLRDVRLNSPVLEGYQVTAIKPEYVLLKSKGGKTIRVE
jgi:hypothetical protein